jgi:hypothetical protein
MKKLKITKKLPDVNPVIYTKDKVEISLNTSNNGNPYLFIKSGETSIGTPLTKTNLKKLQSWINEYLAQ